MSGAAVSTLPANSLIRLVAILSGTSLLAAAVVLFIDAWSLPRPAFQMPVIVLTLAAGGAVLYGGSLAVAGRRRAALVLFSVCMLAVVSAPLAHFLPPVWEATYELDWESLFPPVWPYALAIPLLLFLILELVLPSPRAASPSAAFFLLSGSAAIMVVFFGTSLIANVHTQYVLVVTTFRLLLTFLVPIGLGGLIVLGIVLVHKGAVTAGALLLYPTGIGIEWISIQYWEGPFWLVGPLFDVYPWFPLLPILAGTLPGALTAVAALFAAWKLHARKGTGAVGKDSDSALGLRP